MQQRSWGYQRQHYIKAELRDVKEIIRCRKEREGGKRKILKDTPVASTEEVVKALKKAEKGTNSKKKQSRKQRGSAVKNRLHQVKRRQKAVRMIVLIFWNLWVPKS